MEPLFAMAIVFGLVSAFVAHAIHREIKTYGFRPEDDGFPIGAAVGFLMAAIACAVAGVVT